MNIPLIYFVANFAVGLAIIARAAGALRHHGGTELHDACHGQANIVEATRGLLVTGFYLVNTGFLLVTLGVGQVPFTGADALELFTLRTGILLFFVAATLYVTIHHIKEERWYYWKGPLPPIAR